MGQVLHGCATTTEAIRRAIQNSQESLRALAKRYGINQKTVAKWKQRETVADLPTGPKEAKSTVLSVEDEATIVAFRRHTLLPLYAPGASPISMSATWRGLLAFRMAMAAQPIKSLTVLVTGPLNMTCCHGAHSTQYQSWP